VLLAAAAQLPGSRAAAELVSPAVLLEVVELEELTSPGALLAAELGTS
jgi:hypothetical protein